MKKQGKNNRKLLNEIAVIKDNKIKEAINDMRRVRIFYNDHKDVISKTRGYATRYILPVAYGLLKNGKKAVRAYQTAGSTKRGVPRWKLFLVDNIIDWQNSTRTFKKYKQALIDLGLNINGDKHMTTLFAITPLANDNVQVAKYSHEIDPEPIFKNDVAPTSNNQQHNLNNNKTEPVIKQQKPIDNIPEKNYYQSNTGQTTTTPVNKINIQGDNSLDDTTTNTSINNNTNINNGNITPVDNNPMSKGDINNNLVDIKNNKLTNSFNDMLSRIDNLYDDNNEKENI